MLDRPFLISNEENNVLSENLMGSVPLSCGAYTCPERNQRNGHCERFEYCSSRNSFFSAHVKLPLILKKDWTDSNLLPTP